MNHADEIVARVEHIPPFPKVAQRVMEMIDQPGVKAKELAEVIMFDQAITANILKICNAGYFGLPRRVSSLDEALVLMGQDALKDVIIASSTARYYSGTVGAGYDLGQGELWKHSVATGILARHLAGKVSGLKTSVAFTAGLLHDIGKLVASSYVGDYLNEIMELVQSSGRTFVEAEVECLGISHAELGAMILEKWDFSPELVEAVRRHHDPSALEGSPLLLVVTLANSLVISAGIGGGAEGLATAIRGEVLTRFGFDEGTLDRCMLQVVTEMETAKDILAL
ncbi:MAG: HDOD domain-containing protein [Proteobacteria bacterium]|nr:HDOD domain-containing protein [Pseudomonadota bacterium]MBU1686180.1 HDOD domain-containing protein [Pseudomonadota bacterium]